MMDSNILTWHIILLIAILFYFQGFYCATESEFDDLCSSFSKFITNRRSSAMFELHKERPEHWPPYEPYIGTASVKTSGLCETNRFYKVK